MSVSGGALVVPLRVEPPQEVRAIALRSGDKVVSVAVKDGAISVGDDIPLPWTINMQRFEPSVFTAAEMAAGRPLVLRELGVIEGHLETDDSKPVTKRVTWILGSNEPAEPVVEIQAIADDTGHFSLRLPAGTWSGAVFGERNASRIRAGIVVKAGEIVTPSDRTQILAFELK